MTAVVSVLALAVAVLTLLVAGLLRSHATILRRLHELGAGLEPVTPRTGTATPRTGTATPRTGTATPRTGTATPRTDDRLPAPPAVAEGRLVGDIAGVSPRGDAVALRVAGAATDTVAIFLSSGCTTCHTFWDELRDLDPPDDLRLIVVTKGEEHESPTAIADVAPRGLTVVMSSDAWAAYQVPGSPYVVHVDGASGRVRGEGTGPSWAQVQRMLHQGGADLDARRRGAPRKATADAERERDVDRLLLAAGIRPGDPSLYARADGTTTEPPA